MIARRVTADLFRMEDAADVVELNRFFRSIALTNTEEVDWRFNRNPAGHAVVPVVRDENGRVVGEVWLVPLKAKVHGEVMRIGQSMDLIIHPDYRDGFAYPILRRRFEASFAEADVPIHIAFFSRTRFSQMLREGIPRHTMEAFPALIRPLDLRAACREFPGSAWKKALAASAGPLASSLYFRRRLRDWSSTLVEEVSGFGSEFDEFWTRVEGRFENVVIRDSAFLEWRFANIDQRSYRVFVARDEAGAMQGYTVIRNGELNGVTAGIIMDLLVVQGSSGRSAAAALIRASEECFESDRQALSSVLVVPGTPEHAALEDMGYRSLPEFLQSRSYCFGTVLHPEVPGCPEACDPKEWFVTYADRERN